MGSLAEAGDISWAGVKRAMVFGSVIASFAVEDFSVNRLLHLDRSEIHERYEVLRQCTTFESLLSAPRFVSKSGSARGPQLRRIG